MEISIQARDRILADLGVTEDDLLTFVDVWGSDAEMMVTVWEEVDSLLKAERRGWLDLEGGTEGDHPVDEATELREMGRS
jgi:hypothetical protein